MNICILGFDDLFAQRLKRVIDKIGPQTISLSASSDYLHELKRFRPRLIVLERHLSGGHGGGCGIELCSKIRSNLELCRTPVVFITNEQDTDSRITAFRMGATDYLERECNELELQARLQCRLKEYRDNTEINNVVTYGNLVVNILNQTVYYTDDKGELRLLPVSFLEYRLLVYFMRNHDTTITREEILENVWGEEVKMPSRTVDVHISTMRRRCSAINEYVQTLYGVGYVFSMHRQHSTSSSSGSAGSSGSGSLTALNHSHGHGHNQDFKRAL